LVALSFCHVGQPARCRGGRDEHDPAPPAPGELLAEVVGEVEVHDHVELDDLPQPCAQERDERARVAGPGVGHDEADVEVIGRLGDRFEDAVTTSPMPEDAPVTSTQGPYTSLPICFMAPIFSGRNSTEGL
jgi:hypothetical protein